VMIARETAAAKRTGKPAGPRHGPGRRRR
jgi:hypothetical protein